MLIQVTSDHIQRGVRRKSTRCPIALAICEMGYDDASIAHAYIILRKDGRWLMNETPEIARCFMRLFDEGEPVFPFHFIIEPKEFAESHG